MMIEHIIYAQSPSGNVNEQLLNGLRCQRFANSICLVPENSENFDALFCLCLHSPLILIRKTSILTQHTLVLYIHV